MKTPLLALGLIAFICGSCVRGAFSPVNVGREYGNPTLPWMVSHLPEANQWVLSRTDHHYVLKKVLCFDYICRKMIGRRKALKAISFEEFKKRIRKNAKKGMYQKPAPVIKVKPDSIPSKRSEKAAVVITEQPMDQKPVVQAPILKSDSLIILSELLFELNSYKLNGEHFAALDSLGKFLQGHPTLEVKVSGHTDSTGTERHNVALSTRRAEVVAEYLIDKGAPYDRVSFEGFGSAQPIAPNQTAEGRSRNRRVEILIRNEGKK